MCWACVTSADGDAVEMTGELRGYEYTDEQMAMADTIIERLRPLTEAQRTAVCWHAHN
jgi:hypothetical protein